MSSARNTGQVKWFNNKSGYGFITPLEGEHVGTDIFVHHSSIVTASNQYRYMVQGEYVTFSTTKNEEDKTLASDVKGILGGRLMCEVRNEARANQE